MGADVPWRLPWRVSVAEEIHGDDAVSDELRGEWCEVAAVIADAVEADDARRAGLTPLVGRQRHAVVRSESSESGTSSARYSSCSFTSDQTTVPSRSIRNVPRWGAPFSSSNTP